MSTKLSRKRGFNLVSDWDSYMDSPDSILDKVSRGDSVNMEQGDDIPKARNNTWILTRFRLFLNPQRVRQQKSKLWRLEVRFHHSLCLLILKFLPPPPGRLYPPKKPSLLIRLTDIKADTRPVRISRTKAKVVSSAGGKQKLSSERKMTRKTRIKIMCCIEK